MTVRERVLASRLIEKLDQNSRYAKQIGIDYALSPTKMRKSHTKPTEYKQACVMRER